MKRLEEEYLAAGGRRQTWEGDYLQSYRKLPPEKQLSVQLLTAAAKTIPPNTKQRQRACMAFARLAKFAELDTKRIVALRGRYSSKSVDPRSLPTDSLIQTWYNSIATPQWRWVFGMLATYGLRPHELFHCDLTDFPTVRVGRHTKTGDRFIWPIYPEWAERWQLHDRQMPDFQRIESLANAKLGTKVSRRFYVWRLIKPDGESLRPYDLRHTFARRCFEFGFSPDFAAKMMGHSPELHSRVYRRWIDEDVYRKVYDAVIFSPERPHPPP
ncbi:MAG: integrase [Cyanobacteria bacterium J06621_11]